jgi:glycosyltransferase involved in cell wall biosynthesis
MESNSSRINSDSPLVSIIIPTRNEAEDIAQTLEHCLNLDYDKKEVIVVDDSTDGTPDIVRSFETRGVRLIHREVNSDGCCGARNVGMQGAAGEIVVLMNGDNRPTSDFLKRILSHYGRGADYVIVRSNVVNRKPIWAEYLYSSEKAHENSNPLWSEGFSAKRAAVASVGYIPGNFPVPFCRDVRLDAELQKAGFKKVVDASITMDHVAPEQFRKFWRQWVWRGTFSAPNAYYFQQVPLSIICVRELLKTTRTLMAHLLLIPTLIRVIQYSRYSPRGRASIPGFFAASCIQSAAIAAGNYKGIWRILRTRLGSLEAS